MEICSFLTTQDEKIYCFEQCAFYCDKEKEEKCPFESVTGKKLKNNTKKLYEYYLEEKYGFALDEEVGID